VICASTRCSSWAEHGGYRVSLVHGGYRLGLARVGTDIVKTRPVYGEKDAELLPMGGFDRARWDRTRLRVVRTWHDRRSKPSPITASLTAGRPGFSPRPTGRRPQSTSPGPF